MSIHRRVIARARAVLRRVDVALWLLELDLDLAALERRARALGGPRRGAAWGTGLHRSLARSFIVRQHASRARAHWSEL